MGGYLCTPNRKKREHSSAGLEHLPYKQRVRGSNPCAPTQYRKGFQEIETFFYCTDLLTAALEIILHQSISVIFKNP